MPLRAIRARSGVQGILFEQALAIFFGCFAPTGNRADKSTSVKAKFRSRLTNPSVKKTHYEANNYGDNVPQEQNSFDILKRRESADRAARRLTNVDSRNVQRVRVLSRHSRAVGERFLNGREESLAAVVLKKPFKGSRVSEISCLRDVAGQTRQEQSEGGQQISESTTLWTHDRRLSLPKSPRRKASRRRLKRNITGRSR